jgi:hypothetical protein
VLKYTNGAPANTSIGLVAVVVMLEGIKQLLFWPKHNNLLP